MNEIHSDSLDAEVLKIGKADYGPSRMIVVSSASITRIHFVDAFMESREDLGSLGGGHVKEATPNLGRRKAAGCEACHDAEVVGAAFESAPEVGVI